MPQTPLVEWMAALDAEARLRGYWVEPLPDDVLADGGCWISEYRDGLTPTGALDRNFGAGPEETLTADR